MKNLNNNNLLDMGAKGLENKMNYTMIKNKSAVKNSGIKNDFDLVAWRKLLKSDFLRFVEIKEKQRII